LKASYATISSCIFLVQLYYSTSIWGPDKYYNHTSMQSYKHAVLTNYKHAVLTNYKHAVLTNYKHAVLTNYKHAA
jgi:hypothetical protein